MKIPYYLVVIFVVSFAIHNQAWALGSRPPKDSAPPSAPAPAPTPTPDPLLEPPPLPEPPGRVSEVTDQVDKQNSSTELAKRRETVNSQEVDQCLVHPPRTFAESIHWAVEQRMQPHRSQLGYVASAYGLPSRVSDFAEVSLMSHPLCPVTVTSLGTTLGSSSKVPSAAVIAKLNSFVQRMNEWREDALAGDETAGEKIEMMWTRFFMCLAYTESLTTADTSSSKNVAQKLAPSGYRKPAGVKFYDDPWQTQASRYNIGLFQFTPTAGGNVQACLREWNENLPHCVQSTSSSQGAMVKVLGSSQQTFNAFCGISKITGMFSVQVNTNKDRSTHPNNIRSSGAMKEPQDRCVSLHFAAGRSYNHFGPLQNSTGQNLDKVFSCVVNSQFK